MKNKIVKRFLFVVFSLTLIISGAYLYLGYKFGKGIYEAADVIIEIQKDLENGRVKGKDKTKKDVSKIVGNWKSEMYNHLITLKITNDKIIRIENDNETVYNNYKVSGDTLIMIKDKTPSKYLFKLKKGKLKFRPLNSYLKEIQLMEQMTFSKIKKE